MTIEALHRPFNFASFTKSRSRVLPRVGATQGNKPVTWRPFAADKLPHGGSPAAILDEVINRFGLGHAVVGLDLGNLGRVIAADKPPSGLAGCFVGHVATSLSGNAPCCIVDHSRPATSAKTRRRRVRISSIRARIFALFAASGSKIEFAADSPLEGTGFQLLVRGRGEAGCRAF